MPDTGLQLLAIIILRLEKARLTRQAELRTLNETIARFEELRDQRIRHVRQRNPVRENTYPRNQEHEEDSEITPNFFVTENNEPEDIEDDVLPELERVDPTELAAREQAWIEERGHLNVEETERAYIEEAERAYITRGIIHRVRARTQPRLYVNRVRGIVGTNVNRESARVAQLSTTAEAIVFDILRDINRNLHTD